MDAGVCQEAPYKSFRDIMVRLPNELQEVLFIHKSCGITYGNKVKAKQRQSENLRKEKTVQIPKKYAQEAQLTSKSLYNKRR